MTQINAWVTECDGGSDDCQSKGKGHKQAQNIGIVDDKIVYTQIDAKTVVRFDEPAAEKKPIYDKWNDWLDSK